MKAVVIVSPGGVEGLEIREVPTPVLTSGDRVRVRVRAAGLNRADLLQRMGRYPAPPGYSQDIPGLEFAGEVDELGTEVRSLAPGDRVFGITPGGAQAEYILVPENHLAKIPSNLDWIQAAAVPEAFITAHDALFTQAKLQVGESILVHAAGSGVGTAAIQLAKVAGARVFGTSRSEAKLKLAEEYGLSRYAIAGEDLSSLVTLAQEWTKGRGFDVILDLVGAHYLEANLKTLALRGRLLLVGTTSGAKATLDFAAVMSKRATIIGTVLRARSAEEKATATHLFASHAVPLFTAGAIRPVIDSVYPLEQIREAQARLESNKTFGKIVLTL
jgi:NADPH2:quinone reductase